MSQAMTRQPWKGHVQVAFEHKTGVPLRDWLLEHGPTMTRRAASDEIGYAAPGALKEFVARYLPKDFKFYSRPRTYSVEEIEAALSRRAKGDSWPSIALGYGRDVLLLKDGCRRHKKAQVRAA